MALWLKLAFDFCPSSVQENLPVIYPLAKRYWHCCDTPTFSITEFVELHYVSKRRMYNELVILNQLPEDRHFYYKSTITTSFNCHGNWQF